MTPLGAATSEPDGEQPSINGTAVSAEDEPDDDDEEFRIWKQVTKKDRARVAQERHRLFSANKLNIEEPAPLRTKAAMRRSLQARGPASQRVGDAADLDQATGATAEATESSNLADGMDQDDSTLPDYYLPSSFVPGVDERLKWTTDAEGHVIDQRAECLRALPNDIFHAPNSRFASTVDSNMRQMQKTRKVTQKISVVKQMQQQAQVRYFGQYR